MGNLSNLPTEILLEIITRLPTDSILNCKLVCRPWRDLVSHNSSFYQMYLTHLKHSTDSSGKLSFFALNNSSQLQYFEYNEENDETPIDSIRRFNITLPFKAFSYKIVGSINGLVCIDGWIDKAAYCICNPVTREYVKISNIDREFDDQYIYWSRGFGYLALTNEYKVVEINRLRKNVNIVEVSVYTLGNSKGWRNVGRFDTKSTKTFIVYGGFVDGALHWLDIVVGRIFVFDLIGEKFCEHVSQPPVPTVLVSYDYSRIIGELGGVLYYAVSYLCLITKCLCSEVWLLKKNKNIPDLEEQVEHEPWGWSKKFSIPGREPLAFTKGGSVLCFDYGSISIYDAIASTSKKLVDLTASRIFLHKNTLISLKELGEEDIKIMEPAETRRTKAMICQQSS